MRHANPVLVESGCKRWNSGGKGMPIPIWIKCATYLHKYYKRDFAPIFKNRNKKRWPHFNSETLLFERWWDLYGSFNPSIPSINQTSVNMQQNNGIGSSVTQGLELFTSVTQGLEEKASQLKAIASPKLKAITQVTSASPKILDRVSSMSIRKFREGASSIISMMSSGVYKDYEICNSGCQ